MSKLTKSKKIVASFLAVLMVCMLVPFTAFADEISGDYYYSVEDGKATITNYGGTEKNVVIPEQLGGYDVVKIGNNAFDSSTTIESIEAPSTLTEIGKESFKNCTALEVITLPSALIQIGSDAFDGCTKLDKVDFKGTADDWASITMASPRANPLYYGYNFYINGEELKSATFNVETIKENVFFNCDSLRSVSFTSNVKNIEENAFTSCWNLNSAKFADGIESFADRAFFNCVNLPGVKLPDSVESMGTMSFGYYYEDFTKKEGEITHNGDYYFICSKGSVAEQYAKDNGFTVVYNKGIFNYKLQNDNVVISSVEKDAKGEVVIPSEIDGYKVTALAASSFVGCHDITKVVIPDSVTTMGGNVFGGLKSLQEVVIPGSVEAVGTGAFNGCHSLSKVTIENGVELIWPRAFYDCPNLKEITIPKSVTSIDPYALGYYNVEKDGHIDIAKMEDFTIKCYKGTYADKFAQQKGFNIVYLDVPVAEITSLTNSKDGISLAWNKVDDADGYIVYRKTGNGEYVKLAKIENPNTTTYLDKEVKDNSGTTYTYAVSAYIAEQESQLSAKSIVRLADVKVASAVNAANGITIKWNQVKGAQGYRIYHKKNNGSYEYIGSVNASTTTFTDTKVSTSYGDTITYAVRAYNGTDLSTYTAGSAVRLANITANAANGTSAIAVKWNKTAGAQGYRIYRKEGTDAYKLIKTVSASTSAYTDTAVTSGKRYIYAVRAYNGSAVSTYTAKAIYRLSAPTVKSENSDNAILITWKNVPGANAYYIYRKANNGSYQRIATVSSSSAIAYLNYRDTKVSNGVKYTYAVRAAYGSYYSAYLESVCYRLVPPTISSAVNSAAGRATLKWNTNSQATGYYVCCNSDGVSKSVRTTNPYAVINGLTKGKTYRFYVRSYKTVGGKNYYSKWSAGQNVYIAK